MNIESMSQYVSVFVESTTPLIEIELLCGMVRELLPGDQFLCSSGIAERQFTEGVVKQISSPNYERLVVPTGVYMQAPERAARLRELLRVNRGEVFRLGDGAAEYMCVSWRRLKQSTLVAPPVFKAGPAPAASVVAPNPFRLPGT